MLQDARFALRQAAKLPGYTLIAIVTLAPAIGANTAVFSAVDAVLLHPLPLPHPEQLVFVGENLTHFNLTDIPASGSAPGRPRDWEIGLVCGMGAAFGLRLVLESLLYEISATDPATFAAVPAELVVVALLAMALPAARGDASRPGESASPGISQQSRGSGLMATGCDIGLRGRACWLRPVKRAPGARPVTHR